MKKTLLSLFIMLNSVLFAQGEAAVPSLAFPQSTLLHGAGWIGAAIPNNDAMGFYLNPAILGYSSRTNHASIFFMPEKANWFNDFYLGTTLNTYGINLGYNFELDNGDLPVSVGFGFLRNEFIYGDFPKGWPVANNSKDSFNNFSIGAGLEYYILFNAGISIKTVNSVLSSASSEQSGVGSASCTAFDIGIMIITPISKLLFEDYKLILTNNSHIKPNANFSVGYSLTNLGKEIYYIDPIQSDPIPRTARLGYSFNLGLDLEASGIQINAFDYSFTAEAEDILIKRNAETGIEYQGLFGDINIGKNLINLKADRDVIVHRGHILKLFDILTIASGRFTGRGYYDIRKTNGLGISSEGFFKILNLLIDDPVADYITTHLVIDYNEADIFTGTSLETNLKGITLTYRNFEL